MEITDNVTKKRKKRSDTTVSSSSAEMEPSNPPMDVLALGRHLVHELGLDDETDTLGRWMAHYIAELLDKAERAPSTATRHRAQQQAAAIILRLWRHRSALPGKAYPLTRYIPVLRVIERLHPKANPFYIHSYRNVKEIDEHATTVFDRISRLIIALLLMRIPDHLWESNIDSSVFDALSPEEQHIIIAFDEWATLFTADTGNNRRKRRQRAHDDNEPLNLTQKATLLIDEAMKELSELRELLQIVGGGGKTTPTYEE